MLRTGGQKAIPKERRLLFLEPLVLGGDAEEGLEVDMGGNVAVHDRLHDAGRQIAEREVFIDGAVGCLFLLLHLVDRRSDFVGFPILPAVGQGADQVTGVLGLREDGHAVPDVAVAS